MLLTCHCIRRKIGACIIHVCFALNLLAETLRLSLHHSLTPLSCLCPSLFSSFFSSFFSLSFPCGCWVLIEWGVPWAPLHLDASRGPLAGWQHRARGKGADSGESASRAQRLHVSLHSPESSGLHWYAHSPHSFWYVHSAQQHTLPLIWNGYYTCNWTEITFKFD